MGGVGVAGAGGQNISVRITELNVNAEGSVESVAQASSSQLESAIAQAIADGKRGRGQ